MRLKYWWRRQVVDWPLASSSFPALPGVLLCRVLVGENRRGVENVIILFTLDHPQLEGGDHLGWAGQVREREEG